MDDLDFNINEYIYDGLLALLAILGLVMVIYFVNRFFKWLYGKAGVLLSQKVKGIRINNYDLLTPEYLERVIIAAIKVIRIFILIVIVYLWLPLLFSIFPWTKGIAEQLIGFILEPLQHMAFSLLAYLPDLFMVVLIVFVVRKLIGVLGFLTKEVEKKKLRIPGFYTEWAKPTFNLLRFSIWLFTLVIIFPYLPGSGSAAFQGVSIFLGVLLSLGSTSIVANAVGGFMIIYMRPFIIGDVIKVGDTTGKVIGKNLLVIRICNAKNEDITIPNKTIVESKIINYSSDALQKGVFVHITLTIGYDVPWPHVHRAMLSAARATEGILEKPEPFVLQKALNDFNVSYEVNAYTDQAGKLPQIYSNLNKNLQDSFNQAEIEILSPHYQANRDGNASTIPRKSDGKTGFVK